MSFKILTVVVPCYNTSDLLPKAMSSILRHPNLIQDLEVLIINDGSKDTTYNVALSYQELYPSIVRAINKPNGGWGSVINYAKRIATGKYLRVLDSDDWMNENEFHLYIDSLRKVDADIIVSNYREIFDETHYRDIVFDNVKIDTVLCFDEYLKENGFNHNLNLSEATIRKALIDNESFVLPDKYYADIPFIMYALKDAESICFLNIDLYRYWKGNEGQSTSLTGYARHLNDYIDVVKRLILFYENIKNQLSGIKRRMYIIDLVKLIDFGYYITLSPKYNQYAKKNPPKDFDAWLSNKSAELYNISGKRKLKKYIPFIKIWRKTNINLLNLTKWI